MTIKNMENLKKIIGKKRRKVYIFMKKYKKSFQKIVDDKNTQKFFFY
mgnify:CR=1 FL=1